VSANIDERTQQELYYPAFEAAVQAGVGSVMCSYNKINDIYACENNVTLNTGLKNEMGFEGFVSYCCCCCFYCSDHLPIQRRF
jgi:beta-glucosidase